MTDVFRFIWSRPPNPGMPRIGLSGLEDGRGELERGFEDPVEVRCGLGVRDPYFTREFRMSFLKELRSDGVSLAGFPRRLRTAFCGFSAFLLTRVRLGARAPAPAWRAI